jgi:cyanophycinase
LLFAFLGGFVPMARAQTSGPEKGWLIIDGGGVPDEVKKRFVALAGGPDANIVFIPTALSDEEMTAQGFFQGQGRGLAKSWGINHITMLHTRDKARANSEYFIDALRKASGVLIWGGRQWRLADAYLDTAVEREIKQLLARGGVVCGTSAGATIQGSFLVRGDPKGNEIMISPREREHDLVTVIEKHPELLGLGIDEGAAIVVHGDSVEVVGGQVAVHDGKEHEGAPYYFLSPGQTLNLKTRAVEQTLARNTPAPTPAPTPAAATGDSQANKYPVVLTVISAERTNHNGYTTTDIVGYLSDDPRKTQLHMVCDAGIFSRGPDGKANTYPARYSGKSHQLKIGAREIGSDKVHESTCKY